MRLDINISLGELQKEDGIMSYKFGEKSFPYLYAGRGTYASNLKVYSMIMGDMIDDVHFFQVGRYTSIGVNDSILFNMDHDYSAVFQGVIPELSDDVEGRSFRIRVGQSQRTLRQKGMVIIGSDVWIGNDVTILPDVVIGNGAVIGANSIVTKDVPAYAIYAGNPAKLIRYRFSEDIIKGLEKIAWWNLNVEELTRIKEDMLGDVSTFVEKYIGKAKVYDCQGRFLPTLMNHKVPVMLVFLDIYCDYPTFSKVIEQFCNNFKDKSAELVLVYYKNAIEENAIKVVKETMDNLPIDILFSTVGINDGEEEAVISEADYLFMGRDIRNIMRTSFAMKYGIRCLSNVDKPIFTEKLLHEIRCR